MSGIARRSWFPPAPTESPSRLLLAKGQRVCDHGDELGIRGLALDIRHRVAEVLLQHLDVAPVPGHLDGVANFRDFRPEKVTKSDFEC